MNEVTLQPVDGVFTKRALLAHAIALEEKYKRLLADFPPGTVHEGRNGSRAGTVCSHAVEHCRMTAASKQAKGKRVTRYQVREWSTASSYSTVLGKKLRTRRAVLRLVRRLKQSGRDVFPAAMSIFLPVAQGN